ncbi:hypothetical protein JXA80_04805 [bacterium]|nr:hypothetical protein [candidate division CSSED10-310 bacterium]
MKRSSRIRSARFDWPSAWVEVVTDSCPGTGDTETVAAAVKTLSDQFLDRTTGTADTSMSMIPYGENPAFLAAYIRYYLLVNTPKLIAIFEDSGIDLQTISRVLDIGTGPGTAAIAALIAGYRCGIHSSLDIAAIDHSAAFLRTAGNLIRRFRSLLDRPGTDSFSRSFPSLPSPLTDRSFMPSSQSTGSPDLILVSNALAEFDTSLQNRLPDILDGIAVPGSYLVVMEPARKASARRALHLRNVLCTRGWAVRYPCPGDYPCPALECPRDWCHHRLTWTAPPPVRTIDRYTGMEKDLLNFSPLVLIKPKPMDSTPVVGPTDLSLHLGPLRIVSELRSYKGKQEITVCGRFSTGGQLMICMLENKRLSRYNDVFPDLARYDRIRIEGATRRGDRIILSESSRVIRLENDGGQE